MVINKITMIHVISDGFLLLPANFSFAVAFGLFLILSA